MTPVGNKAAGLVRVQKMIKFAVNGDKKDAEYKIMSINPDRIILFENSDVHAGHTMLWLQQTEIHFLISGTRYDLVRAIAEARGNKVL